MSILRYQANNTIKRVLWKKAIIFDGHSGYILKSKFGQSIVNSLGQIYLPLISMALLIRQQYSLWRLVDLVVLL